MQRISKLFLLTITGLLFIGLALADGGKNEKFGTGITLKTKIAVEDLLKDPAKFEGKKVVVEGTVVDVCQHSGCWVELAGAEKGQTLFVKAKDGEIVFPKNVVHKTVLVEGVVERMAVKGEEKHESHKGEGETCKYEEANVKYQIRCLGAKIVE